MKFSRLVSAGAALAWLTASIAPALADDVGIVPTTVTLRTAASTAAIEVANHDPTPVIFQAHAVAWQQTGATEALTPSTDIRISPPIFTVAPGSTQIVRIGARDLAAFTSERAYRLFIKEVPSAAVGGISMPLQFNLPVFISVPSGVGNLAWSIRSLDEHRAELTIVNSGNTHEHIVELRLDDGSARPLADQSMNLYVLAGAQRVVVIPLAHALGIGPVRVVATRVALAALNAPVSRSAP